MDTTDIRIRVDSQTYSILKEEQSNHKLKIKRTISLANIILHYFNEGINNATEEELNGLKTIPLTNSLGKHTENNDFTNGEEYIHEISLKIDDIGIQLSELDHNIQNKLVNIFNNISRNNEPNINILEIRGQLNDLQHNIRNNNNNTKSSSAIDNSTLSDIKRSLNKIEIQTRKSMMDKLLPYATPLIQLVSHLLLNKKIESSKNTDNTEVLGQLKTIITKLPDEGKKFVTQFIDQNLDDIL